MRKVKLQLDNGTQFEGYSFGYEASVKGEVVFNSAMMGYNELLTDPSNAGQILVLTYPLIGNYGVPELSTEVNGLSSFMESESIKVKALVVSDYSEEFSNWNAKESLADWLKREQVTGITGIDTRELTKTLRDQGSMRGTILFGKEDEELDIQADIPNPVAEVSCKDIIEYKAQDYVERSMDGSSPTPSCPLGKRVVLVDCGVRQSIIRSLLRRGVDVVRVPWDYDFNALSFNGLVISNGPANPTLCEVTVKHLQQYFQTSEKPCMGIGLGMQLMALAEGADTYKLKYGHHSHNQPVREVGTNHCIVTAQTHSYAVAADTLPANWEKWFINMNDGSLEGIRHKGKAWWATQFQPDGTASTTAIGTNLYDDFINNLK